MAKPEQNADRLYFFQEVPDDTKTEKFTLDALKNIQKQIDIYKTENNDLRQLQKNSEIRINNLITENKSLRKEIFNNDSISKEKVNYLKIIKSLEIAVEQYKKEQIEYTKANNLMKIEIQGLKMELEVSIQQQKQLEQTLIRTQKSLRECTDREKGALQKVHEALYIAERAVDEKTEVEANAQLLKDECNSLASTIGKVMDEAAMKVEKDVKDLKEKYSEREYILTERQQELMNHLEQQKLLCTELRKSFINCEMKNLELIKENRKLIDELEITKNQLLTYKIKIQEQNEVFNSMRNEKSGKLYEDRLHEYIAANKNLKEKYKKALNDFTLKFQSELSRLQDEIMLLKFKKNGENQ